MLGKLLTGLVVLLTLGPASALAENIVFRNDTSGMVVVQLTVVINGRVQQSKPQLLAAKGGTSPAVNLPGNKLVVIYDAKAPTRELYRGTIESSPDDTIYSIQPDTPPKLKLVPLKAAPN